MRNIIFLGLLVFLFNGCDDNNIYTNPVKELVIDNQSARFKLEKIQSFSDFAADNGVRNVYILVDKTSGIEYLGVEGLGLTQIGMVK